MYIEKMFKIEVKSIYDQTTIKCTIVNIYKTTTTTTFFAFIS